MQLYIYFFIYLYIDNVNKRVKANMISESIILAETRFAHIVNVVSDEFSSSVKTRKISGLICPDSYYTFILFMNFTVSIFTIL